MILAPRGTVPARLRTKIDTPTEMITWHSFRDHDHGSDLQKRSRLAGYSKVDIDVITGRLATSPALDT